MLNDEQKQKQGTIPGIPSLIAAQRDFSFVIGPVLQHAHYALVSLCIAIIDKDTIMKRSDVSIMYLLIYWKFYLY